MLIDTPIRLFLANANFIFSLRSDFQKCCFIFLQNMSQKLITVRYSTFATVNVETTRSPTVCIKAYFSNFLEYFYKLRKWALKCMFLFDVSVVQTWWQLFFKCI